MDVEARVSKLRYHNGSWGVLNCFLSTGSRELLESKGHKIQGPVVFSGEFDSGEFDAGTTYRFSGSVGKFRDELQFKFQHAVESVPADKEGIVAYLENVGRGNGMGRGTARRCWDKWGSDAVAIVRQDPRKLLEVNNRIAEEQYRAIGELLAKQQETEAATVELTSLLSKRGFPKTVAKKCIKVWGCEAAEVVRKDPYRLMQFRGCGFKLCDALYLELGLDPKRLRRQALCGWYAVASETSGDVWHPIEKISRAIRGDVGVGADPERAIQLGCRLARLSPGHYGALAVVSTDGMKGPLVGEGGRRWVAEGKRAAQEHRLAKRIQWALDEDRPRFISRFGVVETQELHYTDHVRCNLCSRKLTAPEVFVWNGRPYGPTCIQTISDGEGVEVYRLDDWLQSHPQVKRIIETRPVKLEKLPEFSIWPEAESLEISDHQKAELSKALIGRVGILGGSPGTGKTYVVAQLVKAIIRSGVPPHDIAIGAPTGKAAVRLTENLVAAGLPVRARTWHSLLGVGERDEESGNFGFHHNEHNPFPYRVLIGDEMSMQDLALMHAVFVARPRGCHVLLVGDVNQLPPVGYGAPLRDMIQANVPYGELREIRRNSGGIVEACAAIRDGRNWSHGSNLVAGTDSSDPKLQLAEVESRLESLASGMDRVWDIQVLTAVNLRSDLSRKVVNDYLQDLLNPNPKVKGSPFRIDDKIVCTKNGWYSLRDPQQAGSLDAESLDYDGRVYVANGELARVVEIEEKKLFATLSSPEREIVIPRGKPSDDDEGSSGCFFDLAYAISCHKSQGSEWPVVIVLIDEYPGAKQICDRSWIYTAISRAKDQCILVGSKHTADAMCRRNNIFRRKTFLRERIELMHAERMLELI